MDRNVKRAEDNLGLEFYLHKKGNLIFDTEKNVYLKSKTLTHKQQFCLFLKNR